MEHAEYGAVFTSKKAFWQLCGHHGTVPLVLEHSGCWRALLAVRTGSFAATAVGRGRGGTPHFPHGCRNGGPVDGRPVQPIEGPVMGGQL